MGLFRKSGCGNASPGAAQQKAVSSRKDPPPQFVASMPSCNTACIDMHAEASVRTCCTWRQTLIKARWVNAYYWCILFKQVIGTMGDSIPSKEGRRK
eukprot:scaffold32101_cov18-Tisochrysis_lutea.AAC.1